MKKYSVSRSISLPYKDKKDAADISEKYQMNISATIIYLASETVNLLKNKKLSLNVKGNKFNYRLSPKSILIRRALEIYAPFKIGGNSYSLTLNADIPIDPEYIESGLKEVGILNSENYHRAIVKAIIKYPDYASRVKVFGVYTKKHTSVLNPKSLNNKAIYCCLNLPLETYDVIKEIALNSNSSINGLIKNAIKALCDSEFVNCNTPENRNIFKKVILSPPRIIERNMHCVYGRISVNIGDLKYSVQTKCIIEKYGIASVRELFKRVVYFIVKSYKGEIQLNSVRITDNDDYNQTMMIRNQYRKELIYGKS